MKYLAALYWANNVDAGMDVFCCNDEAERILKLCEAMLELSTGRKDEFFLDSLVKTAKAYTKRYEIDEALQCLDTWREEYNQGRHTFEYTLKDR